MQRMQRRAKIRSVASHHITTRFLIALNINHITLIRRLNTNIRPIFAPTRNRTPLIRNRLILGVRTNLMNFLVRIMRDNKTIQTHSQRAIRQVICVSHQHNTRSQNMINITTLIVGTRRRNITRLTDVRVNLRIIVRNRLTSIFISSNDTTPSITNIIRLDKQVQASNGTLGQRVQLNMARILLRLPRIVRAVFRHMTRHMMNTIMMFPIQVARIFIVQSITRQRISLNTLRQRRLTNSTNVITNRLHRRNRFNIFISIPNRTQHSIMTLIISIISLHTTITRRTTRTVRRLAHFVSFTNTNRISLTIIITTMLRLSFTTLLNTQTTTSRIRRATQQDLTMSKQDQTTRRNRAIRIPNFLFQVNMHTT